MRAGSCKIDSVISGSAMSYEEVLEKVKQYPQLWQPSHHFFKLKAKQNKAWQQIASDLKISEKVVKTRWKYLKDQYRKELKRILSKEITKSKWYYYDKLTFIEEELFSEIRKKVVTEPADAENEPQANRSYEPKLEVKILPKPPPPSTSTSQDSSQDMNTTFYEVGEKIDIKRSTSDGLENDADYMFLMSILPTVRNMSDVQKFEFRGKINEWLLAMLTQNEYSEHYENKYIMNS